MRRSAFSLLEVTIAVVVFGLIATSILQMTISARANEASAASRDQLAEDQKRVTEAIAGDLGLSGWQIPDGTTSAVGETQLESTNPDDGKLTSNLVQDRTKRYFPYVISTGTGTTPGGVGGTNRTNTAFFSHAGLSPLVANQTSPSLNPALRGINGPNLAQLSAPVDDIVKFTGSATEAAVSWYASYTQPSQSLIFLRGFTYDGSSALDTTSATASATTRAKYQAYLRSPGLPTLRFGSRTDSDINLWRTSGNHATLGIYGPSPLLDSATGAFLLRPGAYADVAYGAPLESGYILATGGIISIRPQWETRGVPTFDLPATEADYREYIYTVVKSPMNGLGRLVRAHKEKVGTGPDDIAAPLTGTEVGQTISADKSSGSYIFVVDWVLSDNVVRVVFDTYRTDRLTTADTGRLDVNQVRARIYFARTDLMQRTIIARTVSTTVTMRAKNTETQRAEDALLLGTTRPGFPR